MMKYFQSKLSAIRREYRRRDRDQIIHAAGNKCSVCGRKPGEEVLFGPTQYIKRRVRFKVKMDIHVIEGGGKKPINVTICDGCHLSYHLFNRLHEDAEFGPKRLKDTLYKRCKKCGELSCSCCHRCGKPSKRCNCHKIKKLRKTK